MTIITVAQAGSFSCVHWSVLRDRLHWRDAGWWERLLSAILVTAGEDEIPENRTVPQTCPVSSAQSATWPAS